MISLRHKLWFGFGGLLLILLIVSTLSIIVFTRYSRALERVFRENYDSAGYSDAMKQSLDEINLHAQRLIWHGSPESDGDVTAAIAHFESSLNAQLGNINAPGEAEATHQLADLWRAYRADYGLFLQSSSKAAFYDERLYPRFEQMNQMAQRISDINITSMVSVDGHVKQTLIAFRNTLLILVIVGSLLAALLVWMASIAILKPLNELTISARQIEAGNLDLHLPARSQDEIGRLAGAFNSMALRLREFKQRDHDRLVRSEQTTQLAIDSLPDAVFVIGQDHSVQLSNLAARRLFGIEPGRPIGELGLKWLPSLYEEVSRGRESIVPNGYNAAIQLFVEDEERFFLPRGVPMLGQDSRQLGVTVILADVTQLRRVDEAKSDLISTVSHELRTPLTSQRLVLGLLISSISKQLTANQRQLLSVAKADGDRLFRTIEDLLSISRIESGRAQFQYRPISVRDFVVSRIDTLRELFIEKQLELKVVLADDLPTVQIDIAAMGSALTNVLSNAMKFTPPGGTVRVAVKSQNESVTIEVADSGLGIPSEHRPRIFEKFFRVPVSSGPSGAGLGLSIARDIVEAHHGQIDFVCPDNGGSIFSIKLPVFTHREFDLGS